MKISNFKLEEVKGSTALDKVFLASIDVETGFLFWKKKERKAIQKAFGDFWYFVEDGKFTPAFQVECLARSWAAKTGQET